LKLESPYRHSKGKRHGEKNADGEGDCVRGIANKTGEEAHHREKKKKKEVASTKTPRKAHVDGSKRFSLTLVFPEKSRSPSYKQERNPRVEPARQREWIKSH